MRKINRPLSVAALTVAALAPAAAAQAATKTVDLGYAGKPPKGSPEAASYYDFFPRKVTIHAGDKVAYNANGFGVVYSGPKKGMQPVAAADPSKPVSGILDPAGNPFWFNGSPSVNVNPTWLGPAGDGKVKKGQKDTDHGALAFGPSEPYTLTFAKPGRYKVYDALHPKVVNQVVVKPKSAKVPSAAADKVAAQKQLLKLVKEAKKLASPKVAAQTIKVGNDSTHVGFYQFFSQATVKAGEPVTITAGKTVDDVHNLAIGPVSYLKTHSGEGDLFQPAPGFSSVGLAPEVIYPSQPGSAVFDGTQNGGYFNSGAIDTDKASPLPSSTTVTFTKPGTYKYICLFHSDGEHGMQGTITVQ